MPLMHSRWPIFAALIAGVGAVMALWYGVLANPEGETVPVEFLPKEPGEFEFACQMGMIRGKLVVE